MTTDNAILVWLVGALAGSMLFFALVVTPKVFRTLAPEQAGAFLRSLFPAYYLWGVALALASFVIALWSHLFVSLACATVAVLFAYAHQILMPKIGKARDARARAEEGAGERFSRLHRQSVIINGVQLVILLVVAASLLWMV